MTHAPDEADKIDWYDWLQWLKDCDNVYTWTLQYTIIESAWPIKTLNGDPYSMTRRVMHYRSLSFDRTKPNKSSRRKRGTPPSDVSFHLIRRWSSNRSSLVGGEQMCCHGRPLNDGAVYHTGLRSPILYPAVSQNLCSIYRYVHYKGLGAQA